MEKIANFVTKKPKLIILISLLLLIPSFFGYIYTDVNYDILTYLPDKLDSVKGQQVLSETYNVDSTTMVIVENMQSRSVLELKEKISSVDNVSSVLWSDDIIDTSIPSDILPDELHNVFYSENGDYTMMFVQFDPDCSSKQTIEAVDEIKSITQKQCLLSGLTPINADTRQLTNKELPIYISLAVVLVLIIMLVTMESSVLPFILILILGMSVLYNMGTNWIVGGISYITQCIAAILQLAVTMDYSIFLVDRFNEEKQRCDNKESAMLRALSASFTSLAGSSMTTVFGFLALCFMQLSLGFNIGIVMAKGVIIGVISVVTILPAFLLVFDDAINKRKHKKLSPDFTKVINYAIKHKKGFAVLMVVLIIPAIILSASVKQYYNITSTLPDDLDSVVALETLKEEFNMTTSHFIVVDDDVSAEKLIEMENRIQLLDGITSMLAYNQYVGSSIPDSIMPDEIAQLVKQGGYQVMLVNSEFEAATDSANKQVSDMYTILKEYDPNGYITGEGAMYSDMVDIASADFTVTSIISIVAIFVLIALLFKSYSIPLILIATIELAILINQGISTILGTEISFIAPTVISCVQLGATVDYAILLTSRFKEELSKGNDKTAAVKKASVAAMRSVFQSATIFFFVTIGVYFVSSIAIVKEICSLLARGSIISALVVLFILTPILLVGEKFIARGTKEWVFINNNDFDEGVKFEFSHSENSDFSEENFVFTSDSYTEFVLTENDECEESENE